MITIKEFKKWIGINGNRQYFTDIAEKILSNTVQMPFEYERYVRILKAIRWETSNGVPTPVSAWTINQRQQFIEMFLNIVLGGESPRDFTPPNIASQNLQDGDFPYTVLKDTDAWRIFLSHIANSIYMEVSSLLRWSMTVYRPDELSLLLDSRSFFKWRPEFNGYWLDFEVTGHITPTDARSVVRFIESFVRIENIAVSPTEAIANILEWCRHNLLHFSGEFKSGNVESIWQYRGFPPIIKMIKMDPHYTAGCWGTAAFIQALMRVLNIPVRSHILGWTNGVHDTCHFIRQDTYLTHADDCYNMFAYSTPPFPARELMIDQATYDSWFNYPDVPAETCQKNIGRQVHELALKYLSDYLLKIYCQDLNNNVAPQNGMVMRTFERFFTFQELWDSGLWTRLESKVNSFVGCQGIPHSYNTNERPQLPWVP